MKERWTPEQVEILKANPNVADVTPYRIRFTLDFKRMALKKQAQGMSSIEIFREAGFDIDLFGRRPIYDIVAKLKQEAASASGLKPDRPFRCNAEKDLKAEKDAASDKQIRKLQSEVNMLQQQVELLKKTLYARTLSKEDFEIWMQTKDSD